MQFLPQRPIMPFAKSVVEKAMATGTSSGGYWKLWGEAVIHDGIGLSTPLAKFLPALSPSFDMKSGP